MKGNKDDTKDSKWIGDLFHPGLVPGSFISCKEIRILREYTRYRFKPTCCKRSKKTVSRKPLPFVMLLLMQLLPICSVNLHLLITSDEFDPETCKSFLQKSLKKRADAVIESIEGYQMTSSQKERMLTVHSHLEFVQQSMIYWTPNWINWSPLMKMLFPCSAPPLE